MIGDPDRRLGGLSGLLATGGDVSTETTRTPKRGSFGAARLIGALVVATLIGSSIYMAWRVGVFGIEQAGVTTPVAVSATATSTTIPDGKSPTASEAAERP